MSNEPLRLTPGREYELSFSVGVAVFDPLAPVPWGRLLQIADARMHDAKVTRRRQRSAQPSATDPRQLPQHSRLLLDADVLFVVHPRLDSSHH